MMGFAVAGGLSAGFFEELGWTGFTTPKLMAWHSVLAAGILLGVIHTLWHLKPDFWGGMAPYGGLYVPHFLLWLVALTAYRVLMTLGLQPHRQPVAGPAHARELHGWPGLDRTCEGLRTGKPSLVCMLRGRLVARGRSRCYNRGT